MPYRPLALVTTLAAVLAAADAAPLDSVPSPTLRAEIGSLQATGQQRALVTLGRRPAAMAQTAHLKVSPTGGLCFDNCYLGGAVAGSTPRRTATAPGVQRAAVAVANVPAYSSRPGSGNTMYLDFNGHTVTGTQWNASFGATTWAARPFSTDADYTTFTDAEQEQIFLIWQRVSEDYRTFDVNVTTVDPGTFGAHTGRCLITNGTDANGVLCPAGNSAGGIAYLDMFGDPSYLTFQPAWVYVDMLAKQEDYIAEAAAHEIGHNMGLSHDGRTTPPEAYFQGHGPANFDWGPIMGTGYDRTISQWSKGEYTSANNTEDDLAIIAGKVSWLPDDFGDSVSTPSTLPVVVGSGIQTITTFTGIIGSASDVDVFRFSANTGSVSINVRPFSVTPTITSPNTPGTDLDVQADILDDSGTVVAGLSSAPADDTSAVLSGSLSAAGNYFLRVRCTGNRDVLSDGYSTYGSVGQYTISGSLPAGGPGTLGFAERTIVGDEGSVGWRTVIITVLRSTGAIGATSVNFATSDLTAAAGTDYVAVNGTLSWTDGDTSSRSISVQVNGDSIEELDEFFDVKLTGATNGVVITNNTTTVVLSNDDGATAAAGDEAAALLKPHGTGDSGGCGVGTAVGLLGIGGLAIALRRRRR